MRILDWAARAIAAAILLQTLYFKFLGAPESVFIFSELGVEPWGRFAAGGFELIAAVLLLVPATAWAGALLAIGLMSGAILSHVFVLGIEVQNDRGTLFVLAILVLLASLKTLIVHRREIPGLGRRD